MDPPPEKPRGNNVIDLIGRIYGCVNIQDWGAGMVERPGDLYPQARHGQLTRVYDDTLA